MTDTTQIAPAATTWQGVALELGKLLIAALVGAGGLWGAQKLHSEPKPAPVATITADELRKLACPAPARRAVKVEGNLFGTASK